MIQLPEDRRPPLTPQLALRVAVARRGRARAVRASSSSASGTCRCSRATSTCAQAPEQPRARESRSRRRAGRSSTATASCSSRTASRRRQARSRRQPARAPRPRLGPALPRGCTSRAARPRRPSTRADVPAVRVERVSARCACALVDQQRHYQLPYANVTLKTDVDPTSSTTYFYEHQAQFPGVEVQTVYLRRYPATGSAAQLSAPSARSTRRAQAEALQRRPPGHGRRPGAASSTPTTATCAAQTASSASRSTRWATPKRLRCASASPVPGATAAHCRSTSTSRAPARAPCRSARAGQPERQPGHGRRVRRDGPAQRRGPRDGLATRPSTRTCSPSRSRQSATSSCSAPTPATRWSTARSRAPIRRARRSSSITARPRSRAGRSRRDTVIDDPGSFEIGGAASCNAGNAVLRRAVDLRRAIQVSSDVFFYKLGADMNRPKPRGGRCRTGRASSASAADRDRPPGRVARQLPVRPAWRAERNERGAPCRKKEPQELPCGLAVRPAPVVDRRQREPRGRPGRPAGLAAADGRRLLGDRNGGTRRAPAPRPAGRGRGGQGPPAHRPARGAAHLASTRAPPGIMDGLHLPPRRRAAPRPTCSGASPSPVYGKTGTAQRTGQADQSWYVCYVADPVTADRHRRDGRERRLRRRRPPRRSRASSLSQWFGIKSKVVAGTSTDALICR